MDRHAALAMTEKRKVGNLLPRYALNDNNLLYSVTARRLTADVEVQALVLS